MHNFWITGYLNESRILEYMYIRVQSYIKLAIGGVVGFLCGTVGPDNNYMHEANMYMYMSKGNSMHQVPLHVRKYACRVYVHVCCT